ncbi:hypothetical protein BUALT_Bualt09G0010300 [Buddleja alternifolia]|uniref:GUN4-like domain-containing protein n=1 Tax=Buddleja alternifolia TaxID=168488 RepID=A0AAV6X671_9LAMI|nr:hypothetical protein BUALT_Bualt09G0010300 [Buddleja alternifolia]
MATNALKYSCIYHHHHHIHTSLRRPIHYLPTTNNSFFLRPTTAHSQLPHSATFAVSSASASTYLNDVSLDLLKQHLSSNNFREADEETRRLLIVLAGDAAEKRGYVFFSEVQFISEQDLKTIDGLWRQHSDNKFGYSVQKRIWKKVNKDFTKFFIRVGWMKKLESSEVEQYNYRSFPTEFMWEMEESIPEGHLPLTNALRGTQLLNSIFNHPAFHMDEEEQEEDDVLGKEERPLRNRAFNTNYTF